MDFPPVPHAVTMDNHRRQEQYARDNPAESVFETIKGQIERFSATLDDDEGMIMQLNNSFSASISVQTIGYADPSLIYFVGETADGNFTQVIQSVSQLNFSLVAVPLKAGEEKQPIGFVHPDNS